MGWIPSEAPSRNQKAREVIGDSRIFSLGSDALSHIFFSNVPLIHGMPLPHRDVGLTEVPTPLCSVLENRFLKELLILLDV